MHNDLFWLNEYYKWKTLMPLLLVAGVFIFMLGAWLVDLVNRIIYKIKTKYTFALRQSHHFNWGDTVRAEQDLGKMPTNNDWFLFKCTNHRFVYYKPLSQATFWESIRSFRN